MLLRGLLAFQDLHGGGRDDAPVVGGVGGKMAVGGVVFDDHGPDVGVGFPEDWGVVEHAIAAAASGSVVIEGDAELLVGIERAAVPAQVYDTLSFGTGEVDLVVHAFGHVVVESDGFVTYQRAVRAGGVGALEEET